MGFPVLSQAILELEELQRSAVSSDNEYRPLGLHIGGFYLYPEVEAGVKQDSNIFRLPEELEVTDTIKFAKISVPMRSNWNRHMLNAFVSANLGYYDEFKNEDYQYYTATADGRYDVLRNSFLSGKIGYKRRDKDRSSLDDRGTRRPTKFDHTYVGIDYDHSPYRLRTLIQLYYENYDFKNSENLLGEVIDNNDRDRSRPVATFRMGYENLPGRRIFIEAAINSVDYDQTFDNNGLERSSKGYKIKAGINYNLTSLIVGDVFVGYLEQNYNEPSASDLNDPLLGFGLVWFPSGLTTVNLELDRKPVETTDPNAIAYLSTIFLMQVDHELLRNVLLTAMFKYRDNKYNQITPGSKENEDYANVGLGVKYLFSRRFFATAQYDYVRRNSDIKTQEFKRHRGILSIGANW